MKAKSHTTTGAPVAAAHQHDTTETHMPPGKKSFAYGRTPIAPLCFAAALACALLWLAGNDPLAPALALAADSNAFLHPEPLAVGMRSGEEKAISIRAENVQDMYGIEFQLKFDPKVVQVQDADDSTDGVQIQVGDWLKDGFVAANRVDNAKGTIAFAATLLNPAPPITGDGTIATVNFRAKGDGNSPLKIAKAILATRDAAEIKSDVQDGAIGVSALGQAPAVQVTNKNSKNPANQNNTSASAVPGTSTLILLGAAGIGILALGFAFVILLGIVFLRRRS